MLSTKGTIEPTIVTWQAAVDRLDPKLKAYLVGSTDTFNVLNSVLQQAEKNKEICLRKRWKVKIHDKQIVLRDVFDKIIGWVEKFRSVVDIAVQFDTGSASLPWAGIRFLLQVSAQKYKTRNC